MVGSPKEWHLDARLAGGTLQTAYCFSVGKTVQAVNWSSFLFSGSAGS